jgi:hypothetical protein
MQGGHLPEAEITTAPDEDQASAGARSSRASLLHLWRSSVGGTTAFYASEQRTSFERPSRMCRQQMSEHPRLRNV